MHKLKGISFLDSWIMFKRCLLISLRNPEALLMATITPGFSTLGNERRNRYDKRHNRPFPFYVNFKICRTDRSYWCGSSEEYNFKHRNHYYRLCPWFSTTWRFCGLAYCCSLAYLSKYCDFIDCCIMWTNFKNTRRLQRFNVPTLYFAFHQFRLCSY